MSISDIAHNVRINLDNHISNVKSDLAPVKEQAGEVLSQIRDSFESTPLADIGKSVLHGAQETFGEAAAGLGMIKKDICDHLAPNIPKDAIRIKGTHGDDMITIDQDKDGSVTVNVNGKERTFTADEAERLVIEGKAGDDTIIASENVTVPMYILGGRGNDTIVGGFGDDYIRGGKGNDNISSRGGRNEIFGDEGHDILSGGDGRDYIDGGKGNDTIYGNGGNDVIYGGSGDDTIYGGDGNDFINAGSGNDKVNGGAGNDVIFGGRGDDVLEGGDGDDVIVAGAGRDSVDGGAGDDKIRVSEDGKFLADANDTDVAILNPTTIPGNVKIDPFSSDRFKEHMRDDLEALASIEPGQALLQGLGETGRHVVLTSTNDENGYAHYFTSNGWAKSEISFDEGRNPVMNLEPQSGTGSLVSINPKFIDMYGDSEPWSETNSLVITAHELSHSYNSATGTTDPTLYQDVNGKMATGLGDSVSGAEFQAVGMKRAAVAEDNPYGMKENDYRAYLGMPERTSYLQSQG